MLTQAYEKQIKDLNKQVKKLEDEKELIKLDVGARYVCNGFIVENIQVLVVRTLWRTFKFYLSEHWTPKGNLYLKIYRIFKKIL